jgi:hypothetical protein
MRIPRPMLPKTAGKVNRSELATGAALSQSRPLRRQSMETVAQRFDSAVCSATIFEGAGFAANAICPVHGERIVRLERG